MYTLGGSLQSMTVDPKSLPRVPRDVGGQRHLDQYLFFFCTSATMLTVSLVLQVSLLHMRGEMCSNGWNIWGVMVHGHS